MVGLSDNTTGAWPQQDKFTVPGHLSSLSIYSRVRVVSSLTVSLDLVAAYILNYGFCFTDDGRLFPYTYFLQMNTILFEALSTGTITNLSCRSVRLSMTSLFLKIEEALLRIVRFSLLIRFSTKVLQDEIKTSII